MNALDHLNMAGFRGMSLTEALTLMSTVILGDKQKMTEILNELSDYEKTCITQEADVVEAANTETSTENQTTIANEVQ